MKRISVLVLLVVCLALPASARTNRHDDGSVAMRQRDIIERVVTALKRFRITANSWMLGTPKP